MTKTLIGLTVAITCLFGGICLSSNALAQSATQGQPQTGPAPLRPPFKNLQVLTELKDPNQTGGELWFVMNVIAESLSVNCDYCHAIQSPIAVSSGAAPASLPRYDSDAKKTKVVARDMIKMTLAINAANFGGRPVVTCNTCHQGSPHPNGFPAPWYKTPEQIAAYRKSVDAADRPAPSTNVAPTLPDVETVIAHYRKAVRADSLKTLTLRGISDVATPGGSASIEISARLPDKIRLLRNVQGRPVDVLFIGENSWVMTPDGVARPIPGTNQFSQIVDPLLPLKIPQTDSPLRVSGEKIGARDFYVVSWRTGTKVTDKLYFDVQSGLLYKHRTETDTMLGTGATEMTIDDYRDIDGIEIPVKVSFHFAGSQFVTEISDVKANVAIDEATFTLPKAPSEPKPIKVDSKIIDSVATQTPAIPDTPVGRLLRIWLTAFNGGNRDEIQAFYKEHFPSGERTLSSLINIRHVSEGFDLLKIQESTAIALTAVVKERASDRFAQLSMELDAETSDQVKNMGLRGISRPAEFAPPRMSEADALKGFRATLDEWAAKDNFAGAALVAHNGSPVFTAVYGMADREKKIPNKLTTRFRMGSMNKMFTATSILQLVQAGKIKLEDPLAKYLPDYPNKEVASKVTIHHLLTHTGGTGDFFGPEFEAHRLELKTLHDYVKLFGLRGLRFEPGARFEYSNYGYILLGLVIEKAAGQNYYDYVRDHVFKPAGMTGTASEPESVEVADRSNGYMSDGNAKHLNTDTLPYRGTSAGGGYSTVEDLLRFANALSSHKLLDAYHTELLIGAKTTTPNGGYAYGFRDIVEDGVHSFGHGGGAPGMNGELRIFPDSGYVVAVLTNIDQAAGNATAWISSRLPAK